MTSEKLRTGTELEKNIFDKKNKIANLETLKTSSKLVLEGETFDTYFISNFEILQENKIAMGLIAKILDIEINNLQTELDKLEKEFTEL